MFLLAWRPDNVVKAVELGIDLFSGSYPYVITQRGEVCVYEYKMTDDDKKTNEEKDDDDDDDESSEPASKKRKQTIINSGQVTIDLNDSK